MLITRHQHPHPRTTSPNRVYHGSIHTIPLAKKTHLHPCMRAYATVQKLLCHGNYCELILSPVRASLKPSSVDRPAAGPRKSAARGCPRKTSFQIHVSSRLGRRRSVAQASFNHPRWCRPHSVCLWSHLQLGREGHPFKKSISAIFPREFFQGTMLQNRLCNKEVSMHY